MIKMVFLICLIKKLINMLVLMMLIQRCRNVGNKEILFYHIK